MEEKKEIFMYKYSAEQQEEVKEILQKYMPSEDDMLEKLRNLDKRVTNRANMAAIIFGAFCCLVMGVGMCCTMVWTDYFVLGVAVGVVGIVGIAAAYPLYKAVLQKAASKWSASDCRAQPRADDEIEIINGRCLLC